MNWHANAAALLQQSGAAGAAPARLVLDVLLPGAPSFVALAGECLACAAGSGPFPEASAADLERVAHSLALMTADMNALLLQAAELADLPDRAARVVVRGLAADARCRAAARLIERQAGASDRLAAQVRRRLAGRDVAALTSAPLLAARFAGIADFAEDLCVAQTPPDAVRERLDAFTRAARAFAEGKFAEAVEALTKLAEACPASGAVAAARAAAEAAAGDLPAARRSLAQALNLRPADDDLTALARGQGVVKEDRAATATATPRPTPTASAAAAGVSLPGEWFVGNLNQPQAGFDRSDGPTADARPGQIYRLRVSHQATDDQLASLRQWPGAPALYALILNGCRQLTDAGMAHLTGLTGLRALDLGFCDRLTDAGLAWLAGLTGLRSLGLTAVGPVTDAGLAHLAGLAGLRSLELTRCDALTDAGLAHLAELTGLQSLDLSFCWRLTDAGLARLAGLTRLERLSLDGCGAVTDAGLSHLHALTGLRSLTLGRCDHITEGGLEAFRAAAPDCEIWG